MSHLRRLCQQWNRKNIFSEDVATLSENMKFKQKSLLDIKYAFSEKTGKCSLLIMIEN